MNIYIYISISSDKSSEIQCPRYVYDLTTFRSLLSIYIISQDYDMFININW